MRNILKFDIRYYSIILMENLNVATAEPIKILIYITLIMMGMNIAKR